MNSLPYEGVRVLVLGTGPRIGRARQLLTEGGAVLASHFSSAVTYVVIDRTVAANAPQVMAARRAAIPVVTTSELQTWPGLESLAAVTHPAMPRHSMVPMSAGPVPVYAAPLAVPSRSASGVDTTLTAMGWAALPLLTGGLATPFIVAHVARKLRSRTDAMVAAGYGGALALAVTGFFVGVAANVDIFVLVGLFTWLCCWLGGSVHSFLLYEKVARRQADKQRPPKVSDPRNAQALAAIEHRRTLREEARQLAGRDPVAARELGVGRPDRSANYDDGGLIDVNNAPVGVLRKLPGVTEEVAEEIVRFRDLTGPFESTSDVVVHTSLEPRFVDRFDELALYLP